MAYLATSLVHWEIIRRRAPEGSDTQRIAKQNINRFISEIIDIT